MARDTQWEFVSFVFFFIQGPEDAEKVSVFEKHKYIIKTQPVNGL